MLSEKKEHSRAVTPCPAIYERTRFDFSRRNIGIPRNRPVHAPSTNSNAVARTPSTRRYCARGSTMMSRDDVASITRPSPVAEAVA